MKRNFSDINEDFKSTLPSEFMLKNCTHFLIQLNEDKTAFRLVKSDLFKDFSDLLPQFLQHFIPENRKQILENFGIEKLSGNYADFLINNENGDLSGEFYDFLVAPIDSLSFVNKNILVKRIDILSSFIKGYLLCRQLNLSFSKNYLFIESVFVKPIGFDKTLNAILSDEKKMYILTGEPRSGKTYSAYYLLYKFYTENNYTIFQCVNISRFEQLLLDKQTYYKNKKVVIYFEDPFGFSTFSEHEVQRIIQRLKQAQSIEDLKIIITSRKQLFLSGLTEANHILSRSVIVNLQFQNNNLNCDNPYPYPHYIPVYYDSEQIKLIILKISWLYHTNWSESYSTYIHNPSGNYIWDLLTYDKYSPGSIYESFLISSALPTYKLAEFDLIQKCFASGANDLMKAFTSEVSTFVKREQVFYVKLFFVLPAITIIDSIEFVREILGEHHDVVNKHLDLLKLQHSSPFAKSSFTYYHPMFGEAIDQYLFGHGYKEFLDDPELIHFMSRISSLTESFIRDFVCFLFYLDFIQSLSNKPKPIKDSENIPFLVQELIAKISNEQLRSEIENINFFYRTMSDRNLPERQKAKSISRFVHKKLSEPDHYRFFPYLGSVMEHQLFFRLKFFKNEALSQTASSFIFGVTDAIRTSKNEKNIVLISSVFLHSIFANLEYFIDYSSRLDIAALFKKDKVFRALISRISVISEIINPIDNKKTATVIQDKLLYINIAIIWLDAILMKCGELHQFVEETENFLKKIRKDDAFSSYKNRIDTAIMIEEKEKCQNLRDGLFQIFCDFYKTAQESNKDYVRGAIAFSLVWHNRWNYKPGYDPFIKWIKGENLTEPAYRLWDSSYKDGFMFNARYHYDYFLARNDAWMRESSIMIWKIDHPRKGANALYESGIIYWNGENFTEKLGKVDEVEVFKELIKNLFSKGQFEDVVPVFYLIGLRYEKNQRYYEDLVKDIRQKVNATCSKSLDDQMVRLEQNLSACELKNPFK